jgi:hypothetical protein
VSGTIKFEEVKSHLETHVVGDYEISEIEAYKYDGIYAYKITTSYCLESIGYYTTSYVYAYVLQDGYIGCSLCKNMNSEAAYYYSVCEVNGESFEVMFN